MNIAGKQRPLITLIFSLLTLLSTGCTQLRSLATPAINRQQVVTRHTPSINLIDPWSPFTLGNGQFAFTADVTGLQSLPEYYFQQGIPLETKASWAWHSRTAAKHHSLDDTNEIYSAYGRSVAFPTKMQTPAGQWLRQNPHDLPLARFGLLLNGNPVNPSNISEVRQTLDIWRGVLFSQYHLAGEQVRVTTLVDSASDTLAVSIESELLSNQQLQVVIQFPRGYDPSVKNTPNILWNEDNQHQTTLLAQDSGSVFFQRSTDDATHFVNISWNAGGALVKDTEHRFVLTGSERRLQFLAHFSPANQLLSASKTQSLTDGITEITSRTTLAWQKFWQSGAFVDFSASTPPQAFELERRIVLSRYLLAAQSRATIPAQETGLTSSSWYGKHHSEMTWWHSAHWALWNNPEALEKILEWYRSQLPSAKALAQKRGLAGARWAKMVGPDNRESPGGNPLIIWNQPQPIHLAELLYRQTGDSRLLQKYQQLVEETAAAMASMLSWDSRTQQFNLDPPIWIAQEIYDPKQTRNPTFELAYWREGLSLAQEWRQRLGKPLRTDWQHALDKLAPLTINDEKYVAIESIPDTFTNRASRQDHPSMLAAYGLLNDPTVNPRIMRNTLDAVLNTWDWQKKIWGWDYPMIAMTATKLQQPQIATRIIMADLMNNHYLPNGHCPQSGANLPVYLPANAALLAAVAVMIAGWHDQPAQFPGFSAAEGWHLKAEGFKPIL